MSDSNGAAAAQAPPLGVPDHWYGEPMQLALQGSEDFLSRGAAEPFCLDVGRRILLAQLQFPSWVLRRVESVSFEEGRSVVRAMTIHLKVRHDAPTFVAPDGPGGQPRTYWLVPLTLMQRRTLVEFHLRDEEDRSLTMPGLRLAQRLDESLLLAAAAATDPVTDDVRSFVRTVISGRREDVIEAHEGFADGTREEEEVLALRDRRLFRMALARLRYNFTLYAFLATDRGRDRLLRMSFVEPIVWRYQRPLVVPEGSDWAYRPWQEVPRGHFLASALGWTPTRLRFQTPSAEHAASYHFEVVAPKGVRIAEATLLAGRPHVSASDDGEERITVDHVRADALTLGLHAVEVPPNSLCRAQVDLRVQRAGWLTTLLCATAGILAVMGTLTGHAWVQDAVDPGQDTNVIVLLITTAAAVATFVAQRDFPGVAARLVSGMRGLGAVATAVPLVAAGVLSYTKVDPPLPPILQSPEPAEFSTRIWLSALTFLSLLLFAHVWLVWWRTRTEERRDAQTSPWDMTHRSQVSEQPALPTRFHDALKKLGFDTPALAVRSSEGWHHTYFWTDDDQRSALKALRALASRNPPPSYSCARPGSCPHAIGNRCSKEPLSPERRRPVGPASRR